MYGIGRAVNVLAHSWRPWQRVALGAVLVLAGVVLAVVGIHRGLAVAVVGALILVRSGRRAVRARDPQPASSPTRSRS